MPDYYMRGSDGNEYGPANVEQLREWLATNRANAATLVRRADGGTWTTLGAVLQVPNVNPAQAVAPVFVAGAQPAVPAGDTVRGLASELARASGWMILLGVLTLVGCLLYAFATFGIGLIVLWLPIWAAIVLIGAAGAAKAAATGGSEADLRNALAKLRRYFMLIGVFGLLSLLIIPVLFVAMAIPAFNKVREQSRVRAVTNNLRQIVSVSMSYMLENGITQVAYTQIAGTGTDAYIRPIPPVAGENYNNLLIAQTQTTISVSMQNGQTVTYEY